ncbi:alpha-amylase/4-alpha-glucanotransferase domain-containing protein [Methyloradius palustris]|uniref:4-alpha-glucanotransferase n=1 Tax=Methyloradius palustris TaxID=2778876 RepID=A0A8D5JR73_9PROT|nr:alpha-amylase/4-alpha-glucanotransferase domain-containing protein [Methyloradius palustris]BCM25181.1 4-alpha-glucanotransferase [Methyloradius palustris]
MAKTVALLLGVHAHQPVGNFESVLDDAHVRCYGPFLRVLYQYPAFRFAIHISGWLLEYMLEKYPEDMALLKEMVARDQAELFGAGFTEPVLASIPTRDRVGQITKLSHYLNKKFDETPQGAWLTERVWESTVVPSLADSGIQYVTVDDYHFMCTGKYSHELDGYFSTEEDGRQIDLFPISEALRYRLPFSPAHEVVAYLEELADESKSAAAIYFDDIEKFGIWPETYEWVYERGWLKDFIEGVLNSSIIKPMRYSDYHAMAKTRGVVYLPTASYIEMNEWTLPVPASHNYADLVAQEKYNNRYEQTKPYIRGGIWRNFFMRYPESNWMHKRMLSLSARYHAMPENKKTQAMEDALFESQANDAYWHGLFGGLYLPHLRRAIYNAIIKLEAMLDQVSERPAKEWVDLDLDGFDELFLRNNQLQVVARLDGTASICEFDSYKLHHNFGDTLTRQAEHYHRKVHEQSDGHHTGEGIANPHERVMFKDVITPEDMATDAYRKTMFCDFLISDDRVVPVSYRRPQTTGAKSMDFVATVAETELQKTIHLNGKTLIVHYQTSKAVKGKFKVEINLAMPSCNGPAGRFRIGDDIPGGFGELHHFKQLNALSLEDEVLGGVVQLDTNVDCDITSHPHYSVSQSEAGFEKIMQALTLELEWDAKQLKSKIEIKLTVQ